MKIKLLLLFIAINFISYSQTINNFNSALGSIYIVVEDATLDQSTSGTAATWAFNSFATTGNVNTDTFATPTTGELATYPGTTNVLSVTTSPSGTVNQVFTKDIAGEVSITGATGDTFDLNYDANNALIGTFPLNFGDSSSDPIAGTILASGISSPFTGTINTDVDGHGTLIMNDVGGGVFSGNVTRLKTTQNISFTFIIFASTATQISYNYYADNGDLVFRTSDVVIDIPGFSNQTASIKESLLTSVLATTREETISDIFKIAPNPVNDYLNIKINSSETIQSIFITDMTGRRVLKVDGHNNSLNVSDLNSGIYFATITTDKSIGTKKFIKN